MVPGRGARVRANLCRLSVEPDSCYDLAGVLLWAGTRGWTAPPLSAEAPHCPRLARGAQAVARLTFSRHEQPARPVSRAIASRGETDSPCCSRGPDRPSASALGADGSSQTEGESSVHRPATALRRRSTRSRTSPLRGGPPREPA